LAEASIHLNDETLARGSLKEGLARWPSSPLLHYHSYMVLRRHSVPAAEEELAVARDIARRYGYWPLLWQIDRIQQ
jgi:hypothetical protein